MSETWDGVVPVDAPRYRTFESSLNGNSLPPSASYADGLLLRGSHSRYSFPEWEISLSPYTRRPGWAEAVYSLPLSELTRPPVNGSCSMSIRMPIPLKYPRTRDI